MAASDDELTDLTRRYRLIAAAIRRRAEGRIALPWEGTDFGMSNATWASWAARYPRAVREVRPGELGQLGLFGPAEEPMTRASEAWNQLKLEFKDPNQLDLWAMEALRVADAANLQTALATKTFLERYQMAARGVKITPTGMPPSRVTTEALRGVPGMDVWRRPLTDFRIAIFEGEPIQRAREKAKTRAKTLLGTDTQLAHVKAAVDYMRERGDRDNIVGYRRNPRGAASCALCLLASTQRYHRGDLMPIHDHCHCVTVPIYGDREPPQVIEPARLRGVHARIEAATGSSDLSGGHYRDAVIVHHHGELGPVLAYREHSFTGPSDLEAAS